MARMHSIGGSDKATLVRQLLLARGLDARDFDIEESPDSGIGQLLGVPGGIISMRRRTTGEIRIYASGVGSTWFAEISADLDQGYFRAGTPKRAFRPAPALSGRALHA